MNFQKMALFALYLVHAMFGGLGFRGFVLIAIVKIEILATFPQVIEYI